MASVKLVKVKKTYIGSQPLKKSWWEFWKPSSEKREVKVIKGLSFDIKDGEFLVLVGPSGCGKSTALRMIAGLEDITDGKIYIDGKVVNDVSAKDRDIAMVFQSYALYPHMNVYENMAFGLRLRKFSTEDIDKRVNEAAKTLGLEDLLLRKPGELSGGQRQRVAMGRAIVRKPKVFLMDEPLSNLDAKLRVQMRAELQKLHKKLGVTTVYVTHDQTEAMTLGDRIVILKDGIVQQVDTPLHLYDFPANKFVASFIGSPSMNFSNAVMGKNGEFIETEKIKISIPEEKREQMKKYQGKKLIFGIRPEHIQDIRFASERIKKYKLHGTVEVAEPMGSEIMLHIKVGESIFVARVDSHSAVRLGDEIDVCLDMDKMHIFDVETEMNLIYPPTPETSGTVSYDEEEEDEEEDKEGRQRTHHEEHKVEEKERQRVNQAEEEAKKKAEEEAKKKAEEETKKKAEIEHVAPKDKRMKSRRRRKN